MAEYVIEIPEMATLPVVGSAAAFPVLRGCCIGRNYAAHAVEMGHDPDRDPPVFFQKNPDTLDASGQFPYPPRSSDVHHEVELLVALKSGGPNIPIDQALDHVFGYGVSLDMTRRDLQGAQKKTGRPREIGKAFERSGPCGPLHTVARVGHLDQGRVELKVNGAARQEGDLNQVIWKVPEMISYLSECHELAAGDVNMSGTPAGVAAVQKGDVMDMSIEGLGSAAITVV